MDRISRHGDRYIRRLLIIGAQSALLRSKAVRESAWVQSLLGRCARLKVAVALANIGLAPSASLSLPTLATLLVRGFPAMGLATGAAVLISLFRLATRR